jgi:hypothetical protein
MISEQARITWRKSTSSVSGECVEVASSGKTILVRDTKSRGEKMLSFPPAAWKGFVSTIQTDSISLK